MLADSETYPIWTQNVIQIGPAVSEEFGNKHRDTKILCIRFNKAYFRITAIIIILNDCQMHLPNMYLQNTKQFISLKSLHYTYLTSDWSILWSIKMLFLMW